MLWFEKEHFLYLSIYLRIESVKILIWNRFLCWLNVFMWDLIFLQGRECHRMKYVYVQYFTGANVFGSNIELLPFYKLLFLYRNKYYYTENWLKSAKWAMHLDIIPSNEYILKLYFHWSSSLSKGKKNIEVPTYLSETIYNNKAQLKYDDYFIFRLAPPIIQKFKIFLFYTLHIKSNSNCTSVICKSWCCDISTSVSAPMFTENPPVLAVLLGMLRGVK